VHYCGIVPAQRMLQLAMLEEVRTPEPPIRLSAIFFEPGSADQVAAELRSLGNVVLGVGAPLSGRRPELERRGVPPLAESPEAARLVELLGMPVFAPDDGDEGEGTVSDGAYHDFPVFETNADAVFYALQGRRLPAKRHPHGMQLRIEELLGDRVSDEGGDLWHRRIEEIDAAACALCAHRYAVGHASWLEAVILPGSDLPETFRSSGVLPPVERLQLPDQ
jgi:hypothetical protein